MRIRMGLAIGSIALLVGSGAVAKDVKGAASQEGGAQATVSQPADSDEEAAEPETDRGPDEVNKRAVKSGSSKQDQSDADESSESDDD